MAIGGSETPRLWLSPGKGTPGAVTEDNDGNLSMPSFYEDELAKSGWVIEDT